MPAIEDNNPVIVSVAAITQKLQDPLQAKEAYQLMVDCSRKAVEKIACPALITACDEFSAPQGLWGYADPAGLVKEALGNTKATTVMGKIGVLQQGLFNRACQRIQAGEIDVAIVTGGEAKYRNLQAMIQGLEVTDTVSAVASDWVIEPDQELWSEAESNAGLGMPVGYYALLDSAWRHRQGKTTEAHRDEVAALYQRFSEIAADNPDAWKQQAIAGDSIRNASAKNPMLAFPYTKLHNSSWNVDQASALIFCSIKKARELGIDEKHWVYPASATESNLMQAVSQRNDLSRCLGAQHAGQKALQLAEIKVTDIDFVELYSCFPIAVLGFAEELGVPAEKELTVTGGMPFAGGPLNNYVLQATVKMIEKMQGSHQAFGLVSNVSGMNTKQAFCLYSTQPRAFQMADVTDIVAQESPEKILDKDFVGKAAVQAFTVLYNKEGAERLLVIAEADTGVRCLAINQEVDLMRRALTEDFVGAEVAIEGGVFSFL